jgi:hypothetical protein
MNIKSVPISQISNSVKETAEGAHQAPTRDPKPEKKSAKKKAQTQESDEEIETTPEAVDAEMRASQPLDTQTTIELLTHPPKKQTAKFPTPAKVYAPATGVKKLNRSA